MTTRKLISEEERTQEEIDAANQAIGVKVVWGGLAVFVVLTCAVLVYVIAGVMGLGDGCLQKNISSGDELIQCIRGDWVTPDGLTVRIRPSGSNTVREGTLRGEMGTPSYRRLRSGEGFWAVQVIYSSTMYGERLNPRIGCTYQVGGRDRLAESCPDDRNIIYTKD